MGTPPSRPGSASILDPENSAGDPCRGEGSSQLELDGCPVSALCGWHRPSGSQLPALKFSAVNKGLSVFSDRLWIWLGFALVSHGKRQLSLLEE